MKKPILLMLIFVCIATTTLVSCSNPIVKLVPQSRPDGSVFSIQGYDSKGRESEQIIFRDDGTTVFFLDYKYNLKNKLTAYKVQLSSGEVQEFMLKYASDGTLKEETTELYDESGTKTGKIVNLYNKSHEKTKTTYYNPNDTIKYVNEYDTNETVIKKTEYNADGSIKNIISY